MGVSPLSLSLGLFLKIHKNRKLLNFPHEYNLIITRCMLLIHKMIELLHVHVSFSKIFLGNVPACYCHVVVCGVIRCSIYIWYIIHNVSSLNTYVMEHRTSNNICCCLIWVCSESVVLYILYLLVWQVTLNIILN